VHTEAVKCGVCNVLVTPRQGKQPLITPEHPGQSYVECSYEDRRRRLAAIKRYVDDLTGYAHVYIYLPTVVHHWRSVEKVPQGMAFKAVQWTRVAGEDPVINNPIGVVPMVAIENNPDLIFGGRSDLEVAMPIQDAVNKFCLDMQVSSEYHAYPQRWAAGWEMARDAQGNVIPGEQVEIKLSQTRMVRGESPETKFGNFSVGDVSNYIQPIEMYVDHLAAVTQTPAYYLKGKMANLSADALRAADAGLVDRCRHKILSFSDGWEEVMRVAFLAKNDTTRGNAEQAETLWRNPETISLAQTVDAAVKMRSVLSVPVEMCWELLGWSQQQILQAKQMMNLPDSPAAARAPNPVGGQPGVAGGVTMPPGAAGAFNGPQVVLPPGVRR
jgi:hypothetical protein